MNGKETVNGSPAIGTDLNEQTGKSSEQSAFPDARKKKRRIRFAAAAAAAILVLAVAWIAIRHSASVKCTGFDGGSAGSYSEPEKVFAAMSLSYLVYGFVLTGNEDDGEAEMTTTV